MFYKKGEKWIVTKERKEIGIRDSRREAALLHYQEVEPERLEDFKAGKLNHKP
jgi:hypothetical protein